MKKKSSHLQVFWDKYLFRKIKIEGLDTNARLITLENPWKIVFFPLPQRQLFYFWKWWLSFQLISCEKQIWVHPYQTMGQIKCVGIIPFLVECIIDIYLDGMDSFKAIISMNKRLPLYMLKKMYNISSHRCLIHISFL